jgi:hypothetical protein
MVEKRPVFERMVNSEQIHFSEALQIICRREIAGKRVMVISKNDKHTEYARYALHCLEIVPATSDADFRAIQREMAAEWIKLAEAARHRPRREQMQMK